MNFLQVWVIRPAIGFVLLCLSISLWFFSQGVLESGLSFLWFAVYAACMLLAAQTVTLGHALLAFFGIGRHVR